MTSEGRSPMHSENSESEKIWNRREVLGGFGVALGALATGVWLYSKRTEDGIFLDEDERSPEESDYFKDYENGDFTLAERKKRTKHLGPGIEVFQDIGLTFYIVQKGDSIEKIRNKLSALDGLAYLREQTQKIQSFNIPSRELQVGMYLPIPLENEERHVSDEDFAKHAYLALVHLTEHPKYGKYIKFLQENYSSKEIIAVMVAIAKQESGGLPIGQFELHRWEPAHDVFSFSIFHVLMKGPGLQARRKIKRTEGQLYHPQNAAELFFAFMIEKLDERYGGKKEESQIKDSLVDLFQLDESMATFYNGSNWKRGNPHYLKNIQGYRDGALKMLENMKKKKGI